MTTYPRLADVVLDTTDALDQPQWKVLA